MSPRSTQSVGKCASVSGQCRPTARLGRLAGNDNLVAYHTRYYPDEPLVLQGRGAGVDAAAAGVHADIVALASRRMRVGMLTIG